MYRWVKWVCGVCYISQQPASSGHLSIRADLGELNISYRGIWGTKEIPFCVSLDGGN